MHSLMHNCTQLTGRGGAGREIKIALMAMLENCQSLGEGYNNLAKNKNRKERNKRKTANNFDPDTDTMFGFVIDTSIYRIPNIFVYNVAGTRTGHSASTRTAARLDGLAPYLLVFALIFFSCRHKMQRVSDFPRRRQRVTGTTLFV